MPATATDPLWVPVPEAARLLGVTPRTIKKWLADGKLHGRNDLGRSALVLYADVKGISHGSSCLPDSDAEVAA